MEIIDPFKKIFNGALTRNHCILINKQHYIKDLRIIKNKKLSEMLIIDNSPQNYPFQIDNGIPILPWNDDPDDCELKYLANYLTNLNTFKDIRLANINALKLSELSQKTIFEKIY